MKTKILALVFVSALALSTVASAAAAPPRRVTLCHTNWWGQERTILVPAWAARFHLRHGDTEGPCAGDPGPTEICHTTRRGREVTILVLWPRMVDRHLAHGDTLGPCGDEEPQDGSGIG